MLLMISFTSKGINCGSDCNDKWISSSPSSSVSSSTLCPLLNVRREEREAVQREGERRMSAASASAAATSVVHSPLDTCNCSTFLLGRLLTAGAAANRSGLTDSLGLDVDVDGNRSPPAPPLHHVADVFADDCVAAEMRRLVVEANRNMWLEWRQRPEYLVSGDIYSVVILCLFASIILLLMVRAIRPSESLDDQVTILLNSMRVRVEFEDNARKRQKLREAKQKAQRWLAEMKLRRSVQKLSFRRSCSTTSETDVCVPTTALSSRSAASPTHSLFAGAGSAFAATCAGKRLSSTESACTKASSSAFSSIISRTPSSIILAVASPAAAAAHQQQRGAGHRAATTLSDGQRRGNPERNMHAPAAIHVSMANIVTPSSNASLASVGGASASTTITRMSMANISTVGAAVSLCDLECGGVGGCVGAGMPSPSVSSVLVSVDDDASVFGGSMSLDDVDSPPQQSQHIGVSAPPAATLSASSCSVTPTPSPSSAQMTPRTSDGASSGGTVVTTALSADTPPPPPLPSATSRLSGASTQTLVRPVSPRRMSMYSDTSSITPHPSPLSSLPCHRHHHNHVRNWPGGGAGGPHLLQQKDSWPLVVQQPTAVNTDAAGEPPNANLRNLHERARSFHFVPEIVVTPHDDDDDVASAADEVDDDFDDFGNNSGVGGGGASVRFRHQQQQLRHFFQQQQHFQNGGGGGGSILDASDDDEVTAASSTTNADDDEEEATTTSRSSSRPFSSGRTSSSSPAPSMMDDNSVAAEEEESSSRNHYY